MPCKVTQFTPVSNLYSAEGHLSRSSGVHLAPVLDYVLTVAGMKKDYSKDPLGEDSLERYRTMGFVWEEIIASQLNDIETRKNPRLIRPGEFAWCRCCDIGLSSRPVKIGRMSDWLRHLQQFPDHHAIFCTPDGMDLQDWCLEEWKCTWKSMKGALQDGLETAIPSYVWQCQAYCKVLGITKARIRVLFLNGNYSPPVPDSYIFEYEWTQKEIDDRWSMIVRNIDGAQRWLEKNKKV